MKAAHGSVFKYGDNVDTDVIIPARYLNSSDPKELATHCMEDIDKDFVKNVHVGDIIVANKNFGCGSSREHAPISIKASGVRLEQRALDGPSACGLFAGCDIVVEAVDDPEVKKDLVEALLLAGHRVVSASGMAGWGGVPMTARKLGSRLVVVGDHVSGIGPGMPPLAPRVVMAAAMEADAVLEMLLGECR